MNDDNQRYDPRFRTLKRGRIYFNDEQSSMDCQVRDMSSTGTKVKIQSYYDFSGDVILELIDTNGPSIFYDCEVAWQTNEQVGLHHKMKMEKDASGKFIKVPDPDL
jgi:hypothetical protein